MMGLLYRAADRLRQRRYKDNHGRIGEDLALFRHQPTAHADLAVFAEDRSVNLDFQRSAIVAYAGQVLGADVGPFGTDVAVARTNHQAFLDRAAKTIGQERMVSKA